MSDDLSDDLSEELAGGQPADGGGALFDAAALRATLEHHARELAADPAGAVARPSVSTELEHGVRVVARFQQHGRAFELRCDDAPERGGTGTGPSPMRFLLSSIGFSLQVWTVRTAALQGVAVDALGVDVQTSIDMRGEHLVDDVQPYPQWFALVVQVQSPAPVADVVDVVRVAARRCPVTSLVRQAVPGYLVVEHNGTTTYDELPDQLRLTP